jgi:7-cyano-7-deazaguanine reductase
MKKKSTRNLEVFKNSHAEREYKIEMDCPEFTCLCPKTGQPDFAQLQIRYIPGKVCIELKSLKLYLWSFRNEGAFHEKVINDILDDLVQIASPCWMEVIGKFNVRGGIHTTITAIHAPDKKIRTKNKN